MALELFIERIIGILADVLTISLVFYFPTREVTGDRTPIFKKHSELHACKKAVSSRAFGLKKDYVLTPM